MIPFRKMNGLGNDFAVVDARHRDVDLSPDRIRALASRGEGIGFDQFIIIAPPSGSGMAAQMLIRNADGGEVESCGNAARCVAALLLDEIGSTDVSIGSKGGLMRGWRAETGGISIDMGAPRFGAADIPLADLSADPLALELPGFSERFGPASCVNVGNPHAVFFVDDVHSVPLREVGAALETHEAFPERANISFVTLADDVADTRVFERGVGPTAACGTAACAVGALTHKRGMTGPELTVKLPGGPLHIAIVNGRVIMTGPYQLDYVGAITRDGFVRDPLPAV